MRQQLTRAANPDTAGVLGDQITRVANEVARDEMKLREMIIDLIEAGKTEDAVALLAVWNTTAAGDLMTKIEQGQHG